MAADELLTRLPEAAHPPDIKAEVQQRCQCQQRSATATDMATETDLRHGARAEETTAVTLNCARGVLRSLLSLGPLCVCVFSSLLHILFEYNIY